MAFFQANGHSPPVWSVGVNRLHAPARLSRKAGGRPFVLTIRVAVSTGPSCPNDGPAATVVTE